MARIRSTKPEFWSDRKLATRVSRDARLLYVALWNFADEHGRLQGDARYVKGNCLPYDDDLGLADIDRLLTDLERAGRIQRYEHEGDPYIYLPKLAEHQRLEPAKVPSRHPAPPDPSLAPVDPDPGPHGDADSSARRADSSEPDADSSALLYVAGSMEHVAGSRGSDAAAPRADEPAALIGEFLDQCRERPPEQFIARLGRDVKTMLGTGTTPDALRGGLGIVAERGLQPSALAGAVHEHLNARPRATTRGSDLDRKLDAAMRRAEAAEAQHRKALP